MGAGFYLFKYMLERGQKVLGIAGYEGADDECCYSWEE